VLSAASRQELNRERGRILLALLNAMASRTLADSVVIEVGGGEIAADLHLPERALGLVMFAHGSGSSRFSSRNRAVAAFLERHGFATLLLDLLTRAEDAVDVRTAQYRFDIELLGARVVAATEWARQHHGVGSLPIGYFGASTGAAAALMAAAERPQLVAAVVSRGGRPDLAGDALARVHAPTLLIVGGDDRPVIDMNRTAMQRMTGLVELAIVAGATHLFEEPGTLEQVMRLAAGWFGRYLGGPDFQDGIAPGET
jgi:pimeloyl-ACP methyl ester carboxylesterase